VLRHRGTEYSFTRLGQAIRARGKFGYFSWQFASRNQDAEIAGTISAPREAFVGLNYYNPPGGIKYCLNSKIAGCTPRLTDRHAGTTEVLETRSRATFEILTDDGKHRVVMSDPPQGMRIAAADALPDQAIRLAAADHPDHANRLVEAARTVGLASRKQRHD
jgi:hypothetical protein